MISLPNTYYNIKMMNVNTKIMLACFLIGRMKRFECMQYHRESFFTGRIVNIVKKNDSKVCSSNCTKDEYAQDSIFHTITYAFAESINITTKEDCEREKD